MKLIKIENTTQKSFLALTLISSIIGVFLHNPLSGYDIPTTSVVSTPCSDNEKTAYRNELESFKRNGIKFADNPAEDDKYIESLVQDCLTPSADEYAPLNEWHSNSPIIWWFGKLLNILTFLIGLIAIGASGIYIFKPNK